MSEETYSESEVVVYHDETGKIENTNLKGQILLFIPKKITIEHKIPLFGNKKETYSSLDKVYERIKNIRKSHEVDNKFHFKEIHGKKWTKCDQAAKELIEVGTDCLRSKRNNYFSQPLFCKMGIIFYTTPYLNSYGGDNKEKKLRHHETLLRMLLKGTVHYLYDQNHKVKILKIISDGNPYHRKLNEDRIFWRLIIDDLIGQSPLKGYVTIPQTSEIVQQLSSHRDFEEDAEEYIHANMLQLADMLLGSVIHSCYKGIKTVPKKPAIGAMVVDKRGIISFPVKEMIDKRKRGKGFRYSGHYKSFSLSKAEIINGEWVFESDMSKEIEITPDGRQIVFNDFFYPESVG